MKYYIEIDERDIDRFRIDTPCNGSHGNDVLVLEDKYHRAIGFELLKERPHGEWIDRSDGGRIRYPFWERYECSKCGSKSENTNFCPYCGAKMRKEENER